MAESVAGTGEDADHGVVGPPRPPAPVVAAALSGFVVGVFLTLLATGALQRHVASGPTVVTPPPATIVPDRVLQARVTRIVAQQLGPMPTDPKRSRLLSIALAPPDAGKGPLTSTQVLASYRSVTIIFQLNDHPFGGIWRLRAARGDVFAVMKALYTSQLPVYDVTMEGCFPLPARDGTRCASGPPALRVSVVASLAHETAELIPWKKWNRADETRLWALLTYRTVNPHFG
ncbi:MAG TPA: hypothetical protein VFB58_10100 [Chloroflexota bacterium]|nr:hypothetical protein [Chloroflexota bacterium]